MNKNEKRGNLAKGVGQPEKKGSPTRLIWVRFPPSPNGEGNPKTRLLTTVTPDSNLSPWDSSSSRKPFPQGTRNMYRSSGLCMQPRRPSTLFIDAESWPSKKTLGCLELLRPSQTQSHFGMEVRARPSLPFWSFSCGLSPLGWE